MRTYLQAAMALAAQVFLVFPTLCVAVGSGGWVTPKITLISDITVEGNTLLSADQIDKVISPFRGEGRDVEDVRKAADAVRALYTRSGYPNVEILYSDQEFTSSWIFLRVVEKKAKTEVKAPTAEVKKASPDSTSNLASADKPLTFDITTFSIEGNSLLSNEKIERTVQHYTGPNREVADVNRAAEALRLAYSNAGHPVVQVAAPEQTLTSGKVTLNVIEDKIVAIDVKGNKSYSADNIRASLPPLQMGSSLNANRLDAAIALANENSAKQVSVNVQPDSKLGDINTRIDVTEDRVSRVNATLDNTGNTATGFGKIGLAYQHANLFNRDHGLTLQYSGSLNTLDKVYSFSMGYHIPYYEYGFSSDFIAAYSSSSGQNVNLYFSGQGTVLGARLNYALPTVGDIRQKLIFGVDYKDSLSSAGPMQTPITEIPLSLTYAAQVARPEFQGNGSVAYIGNISGGQHGGANAYYNPVTGLGARVPAGGAGLLPRVNWAALRMSGTGGFALPEEWQARVGVNSQFSGDLLLPSEQFGAGGTTAGVRGYPERVIAGDQGYTVNVEFYTPDLNKYLNMPNDSLRFLGFWDTGSVSLNDNPLPLSMKRTTSIDGIGLGVRLARAKNVNLKFDIGWAQKQVGAGASTVYRGDAFGTFSLSVTE